MAYNPRWERHEKKRRSVYVVRKDRPWLRAVRRFDILSMIFCALVGGIAVAAIVSLIYKMLQGVTQTG